MEIVNTGKENGWAVITVKGRMDAVTAPGFEQSMLQWIDEGETRIVVDLAGLEYISSAGLRSILTVAKRMKGKQGKIVVCALGPTVKEVFEISGFNTIIPISDSVAAAVKGG